MFRFISELTAAALLASSLWIGHVHSEPVVIPAPSSCVTETLLIARLQALRTEPGQESTPRYVLRDGDLQAFKDNIKAATGNTPPDDDEILLFAGNDPIDEQILFVSFKNGCVTHAFVVKESVILQFLPKKA